MPVMRHNHFSLIKGIKRAHPLHVRDFTLLSQGLVLLLLFFSLPINAFAEQTILGGGSEKGCGSVVEGLNLLTLGF